MIEALSYLEVKLIQHFSMGLTETRGHAGIAFTFTDLSLAQMSRLGRSLLKDLGHIASPR